MASTQQTSADDLDIKQLIAVLDAYRKGDFTARMPGDMTGLPGKVADTINEIIETSVKLTAEFERVAQQVGKEGKVGERINMPTLMGSWAKKVTSSNVTSAVNHRVQRLKQRVMLRSIAA